MRIIFGMNQIGGRYINILLQQHQPSSVKKLVTMSRKTKHVSKIDISYSLLFMKIIFV